ncbi:MAG: hypothetical protein A2885_14720 [Sphingopyxis sp. RIFCSPHIGHO2_01_FULL_65_24]|nr:MAG: hypothetical protein A2885_14720 [Sphingopyxis sp. RIFCSPHIGHO2_01_FULL_65_24]
MIDGGDGDDRIEDTGGSDTLRGGNGNDRFFISRSNNGTSELMRIEGGAGNDSVTYQNYRSGSAIFHLGDGDDALALHTVQFGGAAITLGAGRDTITFAEILDFELKGVLSITDFEAGTNGDTLNWSTYLNRALQGWNGSDNPFGSSGYLRLVQSGANTIVEIDKNGISGGANFSVLMTLQNVTASQLTAPNLGGFSPVSVNHFGTGDNDILIGSFLADAIFGFGGNDTLIGGAGADTLVGGLGDDTYFVDPGGDQVFEAAGEGYDTVAAGFNYTLSAGAHVELLTTGFIGGTASIDLTGNEFDNQIWGNDGSNTLSGGAGNDALLGFGGNDTLIGGAGNDLLVGMTGADAAYGGLGDDTYFLDETDDSVFETAGEGYDTVAAGFTYTLTAGAHVELLTTGFIGGTASIDLTGNELDNQIWGNDGSNILSGGAGNDALLGFGGNDTLIGGAGADGLFGGTGDDSYRFDGSGDTAIENANEGRDSFLFTVTPGSNLIDKIIGFATGQDQIQLSASAFGGLTTGSLSASAFVIGKTAQDADDRIIYDPATGALLFDPDGNGAIAASQFATLDNNITLVHTDFIVV